MGGMSSQVMWKQTWDAQAEATLKSALVSIGCDLQELPSQEWDPETATIGGIRDYQTSYIAPASDKWTSIMLHLNALCKEPLATALSETAGCAMAFFEYDQAAWGYSIFENGSLRDRFWSLPELVGTDAAECKGDVEAVCIVFDAPPESVAPYIRHLGSDMDPEKKAFEDDEFALSDPWVRCDFMRRLGLSYPEPGKTEGGRHVLIVEPAGAAPEGGTGDRAAGGPASKKPWWRLW